MKLRVESFTAAVIPALVFAPAPPFGFISGGGGGASPAQLAALQLALDDINTRLASLILGGATYTDMIGVMDANTLNLVNTVVAQGNGIVAAIAALPH